MEKHLKRLLEFIFTSSFLLHSIKTSASMQGQVQIDFSYSVSVVEQSKSQMKKNKRIFLPHNFPIMCLLNLQIDEWEKLNFNPFI